MELSFKTFQLRNVCESYRVAKRVLGEESARELSHRLADLEAAETADEAFSLLTPKQVRENAFAISLKNEMHMIVSVGHVEPPLDGVGNVEWGKVTRLKVIQIG